MGFLPIPSLSLFAARIICIVAGLNKVPFKIQIWPCHFFAYSSPTPTHITLTIRYIYNWWAWLSSPVTPFFPKLLSHLHLHNLSLQCLLMLFSLPRVHFISHSLPYISLFLLKGHTQMSCILESFLPHFFFLQINSLILSGKALV